MRQPVRDTWDTSRGALPNLAPESVLGGSCQKGADNVPSVPRCRWWPDPSTGALT